MKTYDIAAQLQNIIPSINSKFGTSIGFLSLSASGLIATAATPTPHGKLSGQAVNISGVKISNSTTLVLDATTNIVTGTTDFAHDLTKATDGEITNYTTVNISGADEEIYNGSFQVLSIPNRKTFTYQLASAPISGPTGTIVIEEDRIDGFNGRFIITVLSPTSFQYTLPFAPPGISIITEGKVFTQLRISRALTAELAEAAYTKQADNANWLFVINGDTNASADRSLQSDASVSLTEGADWRVRTIKNFTILAFMPTTDSIAGAEYGDEAEDIAANLYKSLAGFQPPSDLSDETKFFCSPLGHGFYAYEKAYYIHRYDWQLVEDITNDDCVEPNSRAFRDARLIFTNDFDEQIINTNVDLDDEIIEN